MLKVLDKGFESHMDNSLMQVVLGLWQGIAALFFWAGPLQYPLAGLLVLAMLKGALEWLGKLGTPKQTEEPLVLDVAGARQAIVARVRRENPNIGKAELDREVRASLDRVKAIARQRGAIVPADGEE